MESLDDAFVFNPLGTLKNQLDFVGHQLVRLLQAVGQSPCECSNCESHLTECPHLNQIRRQTSLDQKSNTSDRAHSEESTIGPLKPSLGGVDLVGFQKGNRRSKYFTEEAKLKVAEYAVIHGASAAARKFGIAPSVAAYYQRKMKKNLTLDPRCKKVNISEEMGHHGSAEDGESGNESPLTPNGNGFNFAFRQRGRPKLIGDDLDAELVEHIVEVKHSKPTLNITASFALAEAKNYISKKRPEMLEENGGPINLKITWAMKLVNRVNDRYREKYGDIIHSISHHKYNEYLNDDTNQNTINDQLLKLLSGEPAMPSEFINQLMMQIQESAMSGPLDPRVTLGENHQKPLEFTQTRRALSPKLFSQDSVDQGAGIENENSDSDVMKRLDSIAMTHLLKSDLS